MIAFLISFVVSVVVEMPFLNLDKLLFPNKSRVLESKYQNTKKYMLLALRIWNNENILDLENKNK